MSGAVMVTGGSGFLGSYVCRLLAERGYPVVAYDIAPPREQAQFIYGEQRPNIRYANGQVTDLSRVVALCHEHNVAAIVHTAGFVEVEGATEQPFQTYSVNTVGSMVMYEAARLFGPKVVLVSSNGVYQAKEREPIDERHRVFSPDRGSLAGHYGASKLAAEIIGLTYADANGVDLVVLRMSSIYGFGMQRPLYVKPIVESAILGRPCHLPRGAEMTRDYTYVEDAAQSVLQVLGADNRAFEQRVFNIASGKTHTASDVAAIVRDLAPRADVTIGSGLTPGEAEDMRARGALDITKAKAAFGYTPRYDLREGIAAYIRMMRIYLAQRN